jgi:hypothetical protein
MLSDMRHAITPPNSGAYGKRRIALRKGDSYHNLLKLALSIIIPQEVALEKVNSIPILLQNHSKCNSFAGTWPNAASPLWSVGGKMSHRI